MLTTLLLIVCMNTVHGEHGEHCEALSMASWFDMPDACTIEANRLIDGGNYRKESLICETRFDAI